MYVFFFVGMCVLVTRCCYELKVHIVIFYSRVRALQCRNAKTVRMPVALARACAYLNDTRCVCMWGLGGCRRGKLLRSGRVRNDTLGTDIQYERKTYINIRCQNIARHVLCSCAPASAGEHVSRDGNGEKFGHFSLARWLGTYHTNPSG